MQRSGGCFKALAELNYLGILNIFWGVHEKSCAKEQCGSSWLSELAHRRHLTDIVLSYISLIGIHNAKPAVQVQFA